MENKNVHTYSNEMFFGTRTTLNDIQDAILTINNVVEEYAGYAEDTENVKVKQKAYHTAVAAMKELLEYRKLEEEKRLKILPCKPGDKVYKICRGSSETIKTIVFEGHKYTRTIPDLFVAPFGFDITMIPEIGKTIFLSEDEAFDAMRKMSE